MLERIAGTISRYRMFERGHKVGVAVSGGADSICLLRVLIELAPRWALRLSVLHLDHQLRGEESRADAVFVRKAADELGLTAIIREVDVQRLRADSGDNLEQAARHARRAFFQEMIQSGIVDRVALGHTLSDQAETVLFRLLRGSGPQGLAGILPVTAEGLVRPLMEVQRAEVEQYLRERNLQWREDSSNRDPGYARNRIRHELMPSLVAGWNPALPEALARMATLVRDEEEYWDGEMRRLATQCVTGSDGEAILSVHALRGLTPPVARRLVRYAMQAVKGDLRGISFSHVDAILEMAGRKEGHARVHVPGLDVVRSFSWIRLAPPEPADEPGFRAPLSVPGVADTGGLSVELQVLEGSAVRNQVDGHLDADLLPPRLELRNWNAGDRYRPLECSSEERLKSLFQRHKVPIWERRGWPVIVHGDTVLWSRRFGPAARFAAAPGSRRVVNIIEKQKFFGPK